MTKELRAKVEAMRDEENLDVKKYLELAKEMNDEEICGILHDIAHDEETHARALNHILSFS